MHRFWKLLVLSSFIVILDQLTKGAIQSKFVWGESLPIIDGFFNLVHARNTGAAWSMGAGASEYVRIVLFLALPVLACIYLCYYLIKSLNAPLHLPLALTLILSGAIGNLIDRFMLGYVVDFLDFYYGNSHFPSFNVADSSITVGGFLLAYEYLWAESKRHKKSNPDANIDSNTVTKTSSKSS